MRFRPEPHLHTSYLSKMLNNSSTSVSVPVSFFQAYLFTVPGVGKIQIQPTWASTYVKIKYFCVYFGIVSDFYLLFI